MKGTRISGEHAHGENAGPGNPEAWLRAGLNHHLTFAVRQVGQAVDVAGGVG